MSDQATFETATMELLRHLKAKKEIMQERHARELADVEAEIGAVSVTLRLLRESEQKPMPERVIATVIPNGLRGKSAREACVEIAKRNNGVVRVAEAKEALVSSGILKDGKNTWAIVYTTLMRSKEFEKAKAAGTFRLIEPQGTFLH